MRAIHIDPWTMSVTEIEIKADAEGNYYEPIREAIFGADREGKLLECVRLGGPFIAMIDEEGLLMNWDEQAFFGFINQDGGVLPIAGPCVLLNDDGRGGESSCTLPLDMVTRTVRWLDRKEVRVPAPMITTYGKDGDAITEPVDGVTTEWTYNNQPG